MKILLATNNKHKVEEIKEIMGEYARMFKTLSDFSGLPIPVEDGKTYRENSLKKAMHYHKLTGLPAIADDSGIEIDAFDGKPGLMSARFINPSISFEERNKIVLERMKNVPDEKRGAKFICCCVLIYSDEDIRTEYGVFEGKIGYDIKGDYGFGYDPIFYLPKMKAYLAQIPPEEKNKISHRAIAFEKIKMHIKGEL